MFFFRVIKIGLGILGVRQPLGGYLSLSHEYCSIGPREDFDSLRVVQRGETVHVKLDVTLLPSPEPPWYRREGQGARDGAPILPP